VLPVIPVYFYVTKRLVKPWVKGWQGNIMDHHRTQYLYLESP
jgi:oligopeptide transport system substrate-binding protein